MGHAKYINFNDSPNPFILVPCRTEEIGEWDSLGTKVVATY